MRGKRERVLLPPCVPELCGKEFRQNLKKPSPNYPHGHKARKPRIVPAFTIQERDDLILPCDVRSYTWSKGTMPGAILIIKISFNPLADDAMKAASYLNMERNNEYMALQKNTRVLPPPKCGVFDPLPARPTMFRKCYQRGEFPVCIEFTNFGKRLAWKVPIEKLDFHHYLPMFFDGLSEGMYPYNFIVERGVHDLITKGSYKVLPVVPQLIIPIKNALATKRPSVICHALTLIKMLVTGCERVGEALVPYYRQILPILNLFKDKNRNLGSGIDHSTTRGENVADLIESTLQLLERYGGPDAFINIKYMIPTYESAVLN